MDQFGLNIFKLPAIQNFYYIYIYIYIYIWNLEFIHSFIVENPFISNSSSSSFTKNVF